MDKNELNLKIEELKTAMHNRDFEKAVDIADTLELKKIKDNNFLSLIADAYEVSHRYNDAKKVLLMAYENTNAGRHLAYRLCLIATKNKDYDEAREFYEDFVEMAPRDTGRYILKYRMAKAQGRPIDNLIEILEEYVNIDMEEKWAYELAKLYHMSGDEEKCVDMCDEISLWFSEGKYVTKAMELKKMHHPLTAAQQQKCEENKRKSVEDAAEMEAKQLKETPKVFVPNPNGVQDVSEIKIKPINTDKFNTMEIQEVVADGMKEVELEEEANIHEGADATKVAFDLSVNSVENKEVADKKEVSPKQLDVIFDNKNENLEELEEISDEDIELTKEISLKEPKEENQEEEDVSTDNVSEKTESSLEKVIDTEQINDIHGVEDILKQLQKRGILKAETVNQAVKIISETEKDSDSEVGGMDKDNSAEKSQNSTTKNNGGIKVNVVEPPKSDKQNENKETEPVVEKTDEQKLEVDNEIDKLSMDDNTTANKEYVERTDTNPELPLGESTVTNRETGKISDVPVFDLSYESPARDGSKDIGSKNMYEDIVANSNLGSSTDKLPSKEEIEEAVKDAEKAMEDENEMQSMNYDEDKTETVKKSTDLHSKKNLSAKVEIISGADWKQPEVDFDETQEGNEEQDNTVKPVANDNIVIDNKEEKSGMESLQTNGEEIKSEGTKAQKDNEETEADRVQKQSEEQDIQVDTELALTDEELSVFKNYLNVEGIETSIRQVIKKLIADYKPDGKSEDGNVIIMGEQKTGKTTLAIEIIKLVNKKRGRLNRKLAKVDADALNRRGFRNSLSKLLGSDLIIENAQNLGAMTLSEVVDASGMFTDDMLIILEGETAEMEKAIAESPRLSTVFSNVIRIKEYDVKEWVMYGVKYAKEQGYIMDELANLAFYKAIDDCFGNNKGIGQSDVEDIVEKAISKSSRFGRKLSGMFSSKKDENGFYILVESDFNI